jgi:hypothetical protein
VVTPKAEKKKEGRQHDFDSTCVPALHINQMLSSYLLQNHP